jgi:hypothetical protein
VLGGLLLRAAGGFALYWISLRHLHFLQSQQLGNGYWLLALDAQSYYESARQGAVHGLATIRAESASPAYVKLLAISIRVFGPNLLTAILVNLLAYTVSCALCIAMWPTDGGDNSRKNTLAFAVAALSFSPSLLISATQPLKDQVFVLLVVATLFCFKPILSIGETTTSRQLRNGVAALIAAACVVYMIGGIRAYYGALIVFTALAVMFSYTFTLPLRRWPLQAGAALIATAVLWAAFATGAGPYAYRYGRFVNTLLGIPTAQTSLAAAAEPFEMAREGFVVAGGATNLVRPHRGNTPSLVEDIEDEAFGLVTMTVPITLLKSLHVIAFSGGQGLLTITDIDTLFLDVTVLIQLGLLIRTWEPGKGDRAYLAAALVLGFGVLLPMSYVVTNYGTLFRLRVMYAVPLWLSGAALAAGRRQDYWNYESIRYF